MSIKMQNSKDISYNTEEDPLDWLDLEVQTNETEDKTFQILHQVVEDTQAFRVPEEDKRMVSGVYPWSLLQLKSTLTWTG